MYITVNLNNNKADGLRKLVLLYTVAPIAHLFIVLITAFSIWNLIEVQVGIIAACAMTIRPLLGNLIHSLSM